MTLLTTLAEIDAAIHDEWFDVDRIVHDAERAELRLAFYRGRRRGRILEVDRAPRCADLPEPIGELIVRGVVEVQIEDEAAVGWYPAESLEFDRRNRAVILRSYIPLAVTIRVLRLDVGFARSQPSS